LIAFLKVLETIVEDKIGHLNPAILAHVITNRCNLRCKYCVFWRRKFDEELSTNKVFSVIDQAEDLGISFYSVTGGEPLLRGDIPEILRYAHDKGMVTTLVTNGILLDKQLESIAPHLNALSISLDSHLAEHSTHRCDAETYWKIRKNIEMAAECRKRYKDLKVNINTVISQINLHDLDALVRLVDELDIGITFEPVVTMVPESPTLAYDEDFKHVINTLIEMKNSDYPIWNSKEYLELIRDRKTFDCCSFLLVRLDPDGNVIVPCYHPEVTTKVGTIHERTLKDIIESDERKRALMKSKECHRCYLTNYAEASLIYNNIFKTGLEQFRLWVEA